MPDNSSSNRRLAKNSIFLTIRMVVVLFISLYTTRVVLKVLGVEDYGVYNVVCGFVAMFAFLNTSMSNGIQRFFNYELGKNGEEGANKVYMTSLIIQALLALIIIILVESFGLWYLHNKMVIPAERMLAAEYVFQFSVLGFLFIIMQAPYTASVMAHEKMDFYAVVSILDAVLKLLLVLLLPYLLGDSLILYGVVMLMINVVNFMLYYIYSKRHFKEIRFHKFYDKGLFKSMLGFSGWNLFGSFSGVMKEQGINLVINYFYGPVVNAARGVAAQVNGGLQSFVTNITIPVRPQVIQSYAQGNLSRTMHLTYSISKLSCCFLLMMAIPISYEIDYVLRLWLGANVPEHAALFTIIVFFTSIINNLNSATSGVVHATGIMKDYQLWGSLMGISSVPIAYLLLKIYPIPELALIVVMVCTALGHFICLFVVKKLVGMSVTEYFKEVVWPIVIVLIISVVITYPAHHFMNSGFLRLCVVTLVSVITVGLALYYLALNANERALFSQMIMSLVGKIRNRRNG